MMKVVSGIYVAGVVGALVIAVVGASCATAAGAKTDSGWTSEGGGLYSRQVSSTTTCYAYNNGYLSCVRS